MHVRITAILLALGSLLAHGCLASSETATSSPSPAAQAVTRGVPGSETYKADAAVRYDGYVRSSEYVATRDGTRIAVDVFRPTNSGVAESAPLPVLFIQTQYRRAWYDALGTQSYLPEAIGNYLSLAQQGYVVVCADARGEGASFGTRRGPWSREEALDAHDVIEWSAAQAWSNGKVGMFGLSYMGGIQLLAASTKPPHLLSIFPGQAPFSQFDIHQTIVPAQGPFPEPGDPSDLCLLGQCDNMTVPVDGDTGGTLLTAAIAEHKRNKNPGPLAYRDSISTTLGVPFYAEASPSTYLADIDASNVSVYMYCDKNNWLAQGTILNYVNLATTQKKLLLLAADAPFDLLAEHVRWFDATLKGIDNGILDEAPITYASTSKTGEVSYRQASSWPPVTSTATPFYLAADRALSTGAPTQAGASDAYTVVYDITGLSFDLDARGLTYTSSPLSADTEVTGYPVIHLWLSTNAPDTDVVGWLQDVDELGNSVPVADPYQGAAKLRASRRVLGTPPYNNLGLPWHPATQADEQKLRGEPVELVFDMLFVSHVFRAGHHIRFTLTGANPDTPVVSPAPTLTIHRALGVSSHISLPIVGARPAGSSGEVLITGSGVGQ